jgi:hypothetical protein
MTRGFQQAAIQDTSTCRIALAKKKVGLRAEAVKDNVTPSDSAG